jgi:hypothetical protein
MTDPYDAARVHCAELDREIESIRLERVLRGQHHAGGFLERARQRTGHALMAAGRAVAGPEARPLKVFDA